MKNRFIVLIDFSAGSASLLRFAHEWSKQAPAELLLIHRSSMATPLFTDVTIKKEIARMGHKVTLAELIEFSGKILGEKTGIKYQVTHENLLLVLSSLLNEDFNNLLFIGLKGTGTLKKMFIGSVAIDVINNINALTVLHPKHSGHYSCQSVLVALQKENPLNIMEFDRLLDFNKNVDHIKFISITDQINNGHDAMEKYLMELSDNYSRRALTSFELYKSDKIVPALKETINREKNQFLVVQRGSRLFFDQVFRSSVISKLIYGGTTPLIVVP